MFYSWEIPSFREAIAQNPDLQRFREYYIEHHTCQIGGEVESVLILPQEEIPYQPPECIFGTPDDITCLNGVNVPGQEMLPSITIKQIPNARIIGLSAVLDQDSRLHSEVVLPEAVMLRKNATTNFQGFILSKQENGRLLVHFGSSQNQRHWDNVAAFLTNPEPTNYGQFVHTIMPQLMILKASRIHFDCYVSGDKGSWLYPAIEAIGLPKKPIVSVREISGDEFKRVLMVSDLKAGGFLRPFFRERFKDIAQAAASWDTQNSFPKQIYVTRSLNRIARPRYRPLANEITEIEPFVAEMGFKSLSPESYSWLDQVRMFSHASKLIGPSGSGMLNAVFSEAETKVLDLESFATTVIQHARIYSSTNKQYSFAFGHIDPTDDHAVKAFRRWSLPSSVLRESLEWILT